MEYSKCQQEGDDDDEEEEEEEEYEQRAGAAQEEPEAFQDEPSSAAEPTRRSRSGRSRQHQDIVDEDYTDKKPKGKMAPLEMEESSDNNENGNHQQFNDDYYDEDDDEHHLYRHDDDDNNDAVSLLASETGGGSVTARRAGGDFYNIRHSYSNASSTDDGSTNNSHNNNNSNNNNYGRPRRGQRGGINHYHRYNNNNSNNNNSRDKNNITLREIAAVQGQTCCPVYLCSAVILLALLVAAVFVAPKTTTDNSSSGGNSDSSHYRSPASAAQQQHLQCELDITGESSSSSSSSTASFWDAYVQNVTNDDGNHRCFFDTAVPAKQTTTTTTATCRCKNPTVPDFPHEPASYTQGWQRTFQRNLNRIAQWETSSLSAPSNDNLDVVFLGDSITEHWVGTDLSNSRSGRWSANAKVFTSLFGNATATTTPSSSAITNLLGLALGISGDRCPNLLYRLQNGELPVALQPSIFWILIGTNDVGADQCQASQVLAGTIAIVKYIQQERPNAKIVLNSILPRGRPNSTRWPGVTTNLQVLEHWREFYQPINQALDCFVQGFQKQQQQQHDDNSNDDDDDHHGQLYFFNATDLFLTSDSQSINYTLLPDGLHPGEEGSWVWGRAMVEKIQDVLSS